MKNILITLICVVVACAFIDLYMDNKILETTIILNDKQSLPAAPNTETFMSETFYYPATNEENYINKADVDGGATVITEEDLIPPEQTQESEVTKNMSQEKIDVGNLLKKVSFSDKLFLSSILLKIGGLDTLEKILDGNTETLTAVKNSLSNDELQKLNTIYNKYQDLLGNFKLPKLQ